MQEHVHESTVALTFVHKRWYLSQQLLHTQLAPECTTLPLAQRWMLTLALQVASNSSGTSTMTFNFMSAKHHGRVLDSITLTNTLRRDKVCRYCWSRTGGHVRAYASRRGTCTPSTDVHDLKWLRHHRKKLRKKHWKHEKKEAKEHHHHHHQDHHDKHHHLHSYELADQQDTGRVAGSAQLRQGALLPADSQLADAAAHTTGEAWAPAERDDACNGLSAVQAARCRADSGLQAAAQRAQIFLQDLQPQRSAAGAPELQTAAQASTQRVAQGSRHEHGDAELSEAIMAAAGAEIDAQSDDGSAPDDLSLTQSYRRAAARA